MLSGEKSLVLPLVKPIVHKARAAGGVARDGGIKRTETKKHLPVWQVICSAFIHFQIELSMNPDKEVISWQSVILQKSMKREKS